MRVKNPATMQMIMGIVNGSTPIARVESSESAENVRSSIGGTPLGDIFETDLKKVKNAACADKLKNSLGITAGGREYVFDGSAGVSIDLSAYAVSDWVNGQSGTLKLTQAGTYQIYVPAKKFSEILYLDAQGEAAYGAVHAGAEGSMQICAIGGVVYVYTGNSGVFPTVTVVTQVSARRLFA